LLPFGTAVTWLFIKGQSYRALFNLLKLEDLRDVPSANYGLIVLRVY
jgi:hypothetical protein